MNNSTRITLVRHGETEWNRSGRWQGHLDAPLTLEGEAQARALGERLRGDVFDACYVSDLGRAVRTAELVGGPGGFRFEKDERLRERDLGVIQGMTTEEMLVRYPELYHSFRNDGPEYVVPEGESFSGFYERCVGVLEAIAERNQGGRVLVVTHGGALGAVFRYVAGVPLDSPRRFVLLNCSVNVVEKKDAGWNLVSWGDVAHLTGLRSLDDE